TMVPLPRLTTVGGVPLSKLMDDETSEAIVQRTRKGGGEIVKLLGTSAWYAPGAAAAQMAEAILTDRKLTVPVSIRLDGQYGLSDVYLGLPVVLGKDGIEKVIELDLTDDELALLNQSANSVKSVMKVLDDMNLF
ncbi:MAG TPA: malate dehydrogenase, partial [Bacteroides sp.]|nr:malate dehydrogenase [Bacteroides sp.]